MMEETCRHTINQSVLGRGEEAWTTGCRTLKGALEPVTPHLGHGMGICDNVVNNKSLFHHQILFCVLLSLSAVFETSIFFAFCPRRAVFELNCVLSSPTVAATGWFSSWLRDWHVFQSPSHSEVACAWVWPKGWGWKQCQPPLSLAHKTALEILLPSCPIPGSSGGLGNIPMDTRDWEPPTINTDFNCCLVALATARSPDLMFLGRLTTSECYFGLLNVLLENPPPASVCYWIYLWADKSCGYLWALTCIGVIRIKKAFFRI